MVFKCYTELWFLDPLFLHVTRQTYQGRSTNSLSYVDLIKMVILLWLRHDLYGFEGRQAIWQRERLHIIRASHERARGGRWGSGYLNWLNDEHAVKLRGINQTHCRAQQRSHRNCRVKFVTLLACPWEVSHKDIILARMLGANRRKPTAMAYYYELVRKEPEKTDHNGVQCANFSGKNRRKLTTKPY